MMPSAMPPDPSLEHAYDQEEEGKKEERKKEEEEDTNDPLENKQGPFSSSASPPQERDNDHGQQDYGNEAESQPAERSNLSAGKHRVAEPSHKRRRLMSRNPLSDLTPDLLQLVNEGLLTTFQAKKLLKDRTTAGMRLDNGQNVHVLANGSKIRGNSTTDFSNLESLVAENIISREKATQIVAGKAGMPVRAPFSSSLACSNSGDAGPSCDMQTGSSSADSTVKSLPSDACKALTSSWAPLPITIIDCRRSGAHQKVSKLRRAGYPCVLTGFDGMTHFADGWLSKRNVVDFKQVSRDLGDEMVTCIKKGDMIQVGKDGGINREGDKHLVKLRMRKFISSTFKSKKRSATDDPEESLKQLYLHQWQFAMSASARQIFSRLSQQSGHGSISIPSCLSHDLLSEVFEEFGGDNPYQYLFWGPCGTWTPMHHDPGGLAILIAPITGEKEITLVHRDDSQMVGDSWKTAESLGRPPNLHRQPMAYFARVWRHTLRPGDIALLPAGTYHAVRNMSTCLSYHRMHLDRINLQRLYKSFVVHDALHSHGIPHRRILWNAAHSIIDYLDSDSSEPKRVDAITDLGAIHQCVAGMCLMDVHNVPSSSISQPAYDWTLLMSDISATYLAHTGKSDHHSLEACNRNEDENPKQSIQEENYDTSSSMDKDPVLPIQQDKVINALKVSIDSKDGASSSTPESEEADSASQAAPEMSKVAVRLTSRMKLVADKKNHHIEKASNEIVDGKPKMERLKDKKEDVEPECGDTIVIKLIGKQRRRVKVMEVVRNVPFALVTYDDYEQHYDEHQPLSRLIVTGAEVFPGDQVQVRWGTEGYIYDAQVKGFCSGTMIRIRFNNMTADWDRWMPIEKVVRIVNSDKVGSKATM